MNKTNIEYKDNIICNNSMLLGYNEELFNNSCDYVIQNNLFRS